jgi:hypothetical protein
VNVELTGPAGRLEALLDTPAGETRAAVVIAHPHPEHGGTMRSRVVHEAARGFVRAGAAALRFNYRGVGLSAGAFGGGPEEVRDFQAALEMMRARYPERPLWAAGHAFGAWVAFEAGRREDDVAAVVIIAPALDHDDFGQPVPGGIARFVIHGDRDEVCPLKTVRRFYAQLPEPRELVVIDDADHAFSARASEVGDAIADLMVDFK